MSLQKTVIGGVDVSSYVVSWRVVENVERTVQVARVQLQNNISSVLTLTNEQEIVIQRGKAAATEHYYFRGFVKVFTPKSLIIDIECDNKLSQLAKRQVTNVYEKNTDPEEGVLSALAEDLIETYGELTATVVDSTSQSRPLDVFPCTATDVLERVEQLRKVLDWLLRYDYENDDCLFEPKGTTTNTNILRYNTDGTTNVLSIPRWENDSGDMVNKAHIIGKPQLTDYTETFAAGSTVYTLAKVPEIIEVLEGATVLVFGISGGGGSYEYTVNPPLKQVTLETTAGDTVTVNYSAAEPITLTREDTESIGLYGKQEGSFYFEDIISLEDAETRATEVLGRFSNPLLSTNVDVQQLAVPLRAGETIRVIDDVNGKDDFFVINEVVHQWPDINDTIRIGQERHLRKNTLAETEERLQRLERRLLANIGVVNIVKDVNPADLRVTGHAEVRGRDVSMDGAWRKGFGDGSSKNDYTWREAGGKYQRSYTNSIVTAQVVQDGGVFREDFADSYFINTGSSTASTGSGIITGSGATSVLTSDCVHCEKALVTSAKLKAVFTGTSNFSLGLAPTPTDSPSWEAVTLVSGTEKTHTFSGTGNALFYKVDFTGTGSSVHTTYNTDGGVALWAVKIIPS